MKPLFWVNAALLALTATMAVSMTVVALSLTIYHSEAARLGMGLGPVWASTGIYALVAVVTAGATWAVRHDTAWKWTAQALLLASIVGAYYAIPRLG